MKKIYIAITIVLLFISMRFFNDAKDINIIENGQYIVLTIIIWLSEYFILKGITGKKKISIGIVVGIETIYDIINYIVRIARGATITISDLFAIKTALSVSKNINFQITIDFILGILITIIIYALLIIFRKKIKEEKEYIIKREAEVIIGILIIFIITKAGIYKNYSLWDMNEAYRNLGTPVTILRMAYDFKVNPPEGYNKYEAQEILKKYQNKEEKQEDSANILVIINESFCDYYNIYKEGNSDPIEYYTKLSKSENVISGIMYSSEYGGRTSNIEYEFLTQNSTRILPVGSYAFQQFITSPVNNSIVQNLKSQGYKTSAMHPWESFAYSRNKIYKLFGFDTIKFKDDIDGLECNFNNEFYSDKSTYKELLKELNEKKKGEKVFKYILTVQNHIGFTNPDPKQKTYHEENEKNVYMQLLHESTDALKEVIEELKKKDEKYILLFFGDHQPNLDNTNDYDEKNIEQYITPFLIWANYDIVEKYNVETSTIYLQNYLLEAAGVQYSDINNYMEELQKKYPVITKRFYKNSNGELFQNKEDTSKNYEKIKEYNIIDYYRIFDSN